MLPLGSSCSLNLGSFTCHCQRKREEAYAGYILIVYKDGRKRRASMVEDSINMWSVSKSKDVNLDFHGHFTAEKFERLFENLCKSHVHYSNCIIHMDGAFYHKRVQPCT
ncbi:unnamed protein product [Rhizopus microsporus]|uniref:Tc1-like transposase DDE domain-containing protein n=1 Tax=Rhizopus microsporus TaxID=58291 RepID=A0A1X0RZY8_RHIZD|nr:hypothetical protein BCV71DRAFT_286896 [Rhizopus microsporus]